MCGLPPYTADRLIDVSVVDGEVEIRLAEYFERPLRLTPGRRPRAARRRPRAARGARFRRRRPARDRARQARGRARRAGRPRGRRRRQRPARASCRTRPPTTSSVEIDYYSFARDEMTTRVIDPWRVFHAFGAWYVAAWCHRADGRAAVPRRPGAGGARHRRALRPGVARRRRRRRDLVYRPRPDDPRVTLRLAPAADWVVESHPHESATQRRRRLLAGRARGQRAGVARAAARWRSGPTPRSSRRPSSSASAPTRPPGSGAATGNLRRRPCRPRPDPRASDLRGWGSGAASVTDDVEAPTVVEPRQAPRRPPSGNGSGGGDGSGPGDGDGDRAGGAPARSRSATRTRAVIEWGVLIVVAIVIAIVIKTFLFQAFYIPSASMVPTLEVGDRVLVNKLSYDLHDVHRGDIVVFAAEPNPEWHRAGIDDLVKRVIALPGRDRHAVRDQPHLHRRQAARRELPARRAPSPPICTTGCRTSTNATGQEGARVRRATAPRAAARSPRARYFVMGDNRSKSSGRARPRPDQGVEHRRPRLPAHLAPRPHRLHVVAVATITRSTRRRSRPCGRRGRSRPRRCPWRAAARRWRTSWASHANASTSKRWNSPTRPAVQSEWCMLTTSMPASASRAAWRSSGTSTLRRRIECTRCAPGASAPERLERASGFDEQSQSRSRGAGGGRDVDAARFAAPRGRRRRATARSRCRARRRGRRAGARRARRAPRPCVCATRLRRQPWRATAPCTSTTSPSALRRASDSRPRAPSSSARRKAGSVFSGRRRWRPGGRR